MVYVKSLIAGVAAVVLVVPVVAVSLPRFRSPQDESPKAECLPPGVLRALGSAEKDYCDQFEEKKGCHRTFLANLLWHELVITPSGQKAYLVENRNAGACGSAGCSLYLFVQQSGTKYVQVLGTDGEVGTLGSVRVLKQLTDGHYNIEKTWRNGKTFTLYCWDRQRYTASLRISESATPVLPILKR
jgi:hypothetical protein